MYKRKNFLNVNDSDIFYRYLNFKFYFSSESRRSIFINRLENYINEEKARFYMRYKLEVIDSEAIFAFSLYQKIENRGFKVEQLQDERIVKRTFYEVPKFIYYGVDENE